jgi:hypothetical protein
MQLCKGVAMWLEMDVVNTWEILKNLLDSNLSDAMLTLVFVYMLVASILRHNSAALDKLIALLQAMVERRK